MLSGAAKCKKKKNEEEQKKRQRGAIQKFLSGSRPTAVNLLVLAEPEAEPGPETRPEDAAEDASAPSTSAPSQENDKMMEEQQPARKSEPNIVLMEPLDPERVLTSYPSDPAKWDQIDDRMRMLEHAKWFPQCEYGLQEKGQEFLFTQFRLVFLGCLSRVQSSKAHRPEKHPDQWRELLNSPDQELSC
ncbi:unnamed protein product [Pleuronectes platessa]|uniref:Uncharacterized protein n=1 Tax=Pleuronectes platessa TaxID=8262 RepID=A0A9N7USV9_PLEPL|nr:unnamed protein product [Pleuronectes platessa]